MRGCTAAAGRSCGAAVRLCPWCTRLVTVVPFLEPLPHTCARQGEFSAACRLGQEGPSWQLTGLPVHSSGSSGRMGCACKGALLGVSVLLGLLGMQPSSDDEAALDGG